MLSRSEMRIAVAKQWSVNGQRQDRGHSASEGRTTQITDRNKGRWIRFVPKHQLRQQLVRHIGSE